ncbi:MAG TPA: Dabb family protein [Rhizobiaceae bacterium]|nr:Dabb family protein [Rhizobiaceae bacterium]
MITHTCVFRLKHAKGSDAEASFIKAAKVLAKIAGVQELSVMKQTFAKSPYSHLLTMKFSNRAAYDGYMNHPDHVIFTRERWDKEVVDFMILDYEALGRNPLPRPRPGGSAAEAIRPRIPAPPKART